jgi:cell division protein FtsB
MAAHKKKTDKRVILTPRGAILILVLTGALFSSVYPVRRYLSVRSSIATLRTEEHALDQRAKDLRKQKALLQTDAEVERIARADLGMARPGEIVFDIVRPKVRPSVGRAVDPAGLLAPEKTPKKGLFARFWSAVLRATHTIH